MVPDAAPGAVFELFHGYIERAWNNNGMHFLFVWIKTHGIRHGQVVVC